MGEADRNFAIDGHVLKLHATETDAASLDLQDAAMEHVAARSLLVQTPRPVRAVDATARIVLEDGGFARVLTWVPGTPWAMARSRTARPHCAASVAQSLSLTGRSPRSSIRSSTGDCPGT